MDWISVKDRLPSTYENVILKARSVPKDYRRNDGLIFIGYLTGKIDPDLDRRGWDSVWGDNWVPFEFEDITHWMPLPDPPKGD